MKIEKTSEGNCKNKKSEAVDASLLVLSVFHIIHLWSIRRDSLSSPIGWRHQNW